MVKLSRFDDKDALAGDFLCEAEKLVSLSIEVMNERVADPEYDVTVLVYSLIVDDRLGERVMSV